MSFHYGKHQAILLVIAAVEKEVASIEKTGKIHAQTDF